MDRRSLFGVLTGAAVAIPTAAFATDWRKGWKALADGLMPKRCPKCSLGPHFHQISKLPVYERYLAGSPYEQPVLSHYHEKWMTPRGEVWISRWPSMDDSHTHTAVEDAMFAMYPHG